MVGVNGRSFVAGDFGRVLMQYDDLAGAATNDIEARIRQLAEDGIQKELAFPNAVLALFHYLDKALRERVFRSTTSTSQICRNGRADASTASA